MSALPRIATVKADLRKKSCPLCSPKRTCAAQTVISALGPKADITPSADTDMTWPRRGSAGHAESSPRTNAKRAPISTGERGGSGSAFAPRIQRRSTGSDYRNRDCPPKYCLYGSSLQTSDTGSPNSYYLCLSRSLRTMGPRKPELAMDQRPAV